VCARVFCGGRRHEDYKFLEFDGDRMLVLGVGDSGIVCFVIDRYVPRARSLSFVHAHSPAN